MDIKSWTGERLETFVNSEVAVEHLHRYAIVLALIKGKNVLDIASGEGYGSNLIAENAAEVTGVDIDKDAVERARLKYKKSNLKFVEGSAADIPLETGYFDVVVSFETIEHHDRHDEMISEIKRVLKPGGLLIISSPDKLNYTEKRNFKNVFHIKELYADEFKTLIRKYFSNAAFYNQRASFVSLLVPDEGRHGFAEYRGSYDHVTRNQEFGQMYILGIASDNALPEVGLSAFTDDDMIPRLTENTVTQVRSSLSYKIGHAALWPLKAVRKLIS
jgi:2-polyprenyl-3-methyl-5-hydroxy-6-metoxy-1,4-benzoquinol methylase